MFSKESCIVLLHSTYFKFWNMYVQWRTLAIIWIYGRQWQSQQSLYLIGIYLYRFRDLFIFEIYYFTLFEISFLRYYFLRYVYTVFEIYRHLFLRYIGTGFWSRISLQYGIVPYHAVPYINFPEWRKGTVGKTA